MPLGKEVGLGPGHIALDGDPVGTQPPTAAPPHFRPMPIVAKRSPISATAELLLYIYNKITTNYKRSRIFGINCCGRKVKIAELMDTRTQRKPQLSVAASCRQYPAARGVTTRCVCDTANQANERRIVEDQLLSTLHMPPLSLLPDIRMYHL